MHKPLTLDELLHYAENPDLIPEPPDNIILFPPENDGWETDEDSGEEDQVTLNNLPGSQLRARAEFSYDVKRDEGDVVPNHNVNVDDALADENWESEDDLPLQD